MDGSKGNDLWEHIMKVGKEFNIAPAAPNQISRIENGMLSYGSDMTLEETPYDINMGKFVHLEKNADFLSKSALIKIFNDGTSKELVGIEISGNIQSNYDPDHKSIYVNEEIVGKITSSVFSPRLEKNIAIGIIRKQNDKKLVHHIKSNNEKINIKISSLPFIRNK